MAATREGALLERAENRSSERRCWGTRSGCDRTQGVTPVAFGGATVVATRQSSPDPNAARRGARVPGHRKGCACDDRSAPQAFAAVLAAADAAPDADPGRLDARVRGQRRGRRPASRRPAHRPDGRGGARLGRRAVRQLLGPDRLVPLPPAPGGAGRDPRRARVRGRGCRGGPVVGRGGGARGFGAVGPVQQDG